MAILYKIKSDTFYFNIFQQVKNANLKRKPNKHDLSGKIREFSFWKYFLFMKLHVGTHQYNQLQMLQPTVLSWNIHFLAWVQHTCIDLLMFFQSKQISSWYMGSVGSTVGQCLCRICRTRNFINMINQGVWKCSGIIHWQFLGHSNQKITICTLHLIRTWILFFSPLNPEALIV